MLGRALSSDREAVDGKSRSEGSHGEVEGSDTKAVMSNRWVAHAAGAALVVGGIGFSCLLLVAGCKDRGEPPPPSKLAHPIHSAVSGLLATPLVPPRPAAPSVTTDRRAVLHDLAECSNAELRRCLAPLLKPRMTSADILALDTARCFKHGRDGLLAQAGDCLPLRVGVDAHLRKTLLFRYYCSDICPDYGDVIMTYEDVSADECCKLGAAPFFDPAWGGYRGCQPAEIAARGGVLQHATDGKWRHIVGSGCPGRGPTIYEEWDCEPPPSSRPPLGVTGGPLSPNARPAPNIVRHPSPECPTAFDPVEAETALRAFDEEARACLMPKLFGTARVHVTFVGTGNVEAASVAESPSLTNDQRRCMERSYRRVHTLPFKGERVDVWHELSLGNDGGKGAGGG